MHTKSSLSFDLLPVLVAQILYSQLLALVRNNVLWLYIQSQFICSLHFIIFRKKISNISEVLYELSLYSVNKQDKQPNLAKPLGKAHGTLTFGLPTPLAETRRQSLINSFWSDQILNSSFQLFWTSILLHYVHSTIHTFFICRLV